MADDLQEEIKKRPTVEELLRLLKSSSSTGFKRPSPPPIPPKPRHNFEVTIETARRNLGLVSSRSSDADSMNRTFLVDGDRANRTSAKRADAGITVNDNVDIDYDSCVSKVKLDSNTLSDQLTSRLLFYENNQPTNNKLDADPIKSHGGCVVYNSASSANIVYQQQPSMANSGTNTNRNYAYKGDNHINHRHHHHRAEPFVTEIPEEANNNNINSRPTRNTTSTVEILEVPIVGQLSHDNHGNSIDDPTKVDIVDEISLTKDINDCDDDEVDFDVVDAEVEVDEIASDEVPISSTPTLKNVTSEHITYLGQNGTVNSDSNNSNENTLNISRETDEMNNSGAHNQSGCELIGINDLSDSKDSPSKKSEQEKSTYKMSLVNGDRLNERTENSNLRQLVTTLQCDIDNLNNKVSSLTNKVAYLEDKLREAPNVASIPSTPIQDTSLSNKRTPISLRQTAPKQNYHTISTSAKRLQQPTRSFNNITKSQVKNSNIYTSTSSLYADSIKSGSASISPTPSSYLNSTQKRDTSLFTSMMSLSSIGNSTLKNWPSMSNFIDSEHQAKDITYDLDEQVIRMILYKTSITIRVPSALRSSYHLDEFVIEPPAIRLKLDWVHGYRGIDCRSNIHYLPTGECIYFVASVVVLYNPVEKTQRHYLGHTDSVKCLAIHPNRLIVASGQSAIVNCRDKRPIVRVWNTVSLATLRVIGFNEDFDRSICCLAFSKHDAGATLAVVDESSEHTITLLDWQREKNWRVAEVNSGHERVLAIDFHPIDKYSLVAIGRSSINFWDIRGMTLAKKAGLFDKYDRPKYVLCLTFNDIGETITGDSNGNIIIWPRGTNKPRRIIREAHPGGVFSVLAMKDGRYLTGGHDRRIMEWDENFEHTGRQTELPEHCGGVRYITTARGLQVFVGTLRNTILMGSMEDGFEIIVQGHTRATSALAIHPTLPRYLTGGFDDQIHCMDARSHLIQWSKCLAVPITSAAFSPNGVLLIVGSKLGDWLALEANTQETLFTASDGTGNINCVKFSPNGRYFCLGSSDCQIYIYETNVQGSLFIRVGTCVGHSAPIKEIDWSTDNGYIQSQSMNFELKFWKAQNCRTADSDEIVHDLDWATHNCTIGFNAIGLWSDSIDSALINYCDRSNNDKYFVSATDTGYINIYRWPTYYNRCLSQKYYANLDKLNFIKFLYDDSSLIAVGAESCATSEWSVIPDDDS